MNLLITGATGFIGSACVRAALARGHKVAGLVRPQTLARLSELPAGAITWIEGDLTNPDWAALQAFGPEACLHTAWIATPGEYLHSPMNRDFLRWSVTFLERLASIGMQYCIALGTCIEYGPQQGLLNEVTSVVAPLSEYARAKDALRRTLEESSLDHCWARIFFPFGPGEDARRLASSVVVTALRKQDIVLKSPNSIRDFVFIDDIANALLTILGRRFRGIINIGSGTGVTIRSIAETIVGIVGESPRLIVPVEISDPNDCIVADTTLLTGLGWQPKYDIHSGLTALVSNLTKPHYEARN